MDTFICMAILKYYRANVVFLDHEVTILWFDIIICAIYTKNLIKLICRSYIISYNRRLPDLSKVRQQINVVPN